MIVFQFDFGLHLIKDDLFTGVAAQIGDVESPLQSQKALLSLFFG